MKFFWVLFGLLALSQAFSDHKQYDLPEYEKKSFDERYRDYAKPYYPGRDHFDFSGYKRGGYGGHKNKCRDMKYFSSKKHYCPNKGYGNSHYGGYEKKDRCPEVLCDYWARYGSTKCLKQVKLYKPFWYLGKECRYPGKDCDRDDYHYPTSGYRDGGYRSANPGGYVAKGYQPKSSCECQTIWCLKKIYTVYEHYGKYLKGYVTVKVPCKCDCRKKTNHFW